MFLVIKWRPTLELISSLILSKFLARIPPYTTNQFSGVEVDLNRDYRPLKALHWTFLHESAEKSTEHLRYNEGMDRYYVVQSKFEAGFRKELYVIGSVPGLGTRNGPRFR